MPRKARATVRQRRHHARRMRKAFQVAGIIALGVPAFAGCLFIAACLGANLALVTV